VPPAEPDALSAGLRPPHAALPERPPPRGHRGTTAKTAQRALAATVAGGLGLAVSLGGLAVQMLPRRFTAAQQRQITTWEVSRRWRTLPAGDIFPASVRYELPASVLEDFTGVTLTAHRIGIAPQASCAAAADPAAARMLGRHGCEAILRAGYDAASGTYVMTIGVAVLPSARQASAAQAALAAPGGGAQLRPGVRAVAFGGTAAQGFGDAQRQISASVSEGPYIVMYTAGYADGRRRVPISDDPYAEHEMTSAAQGVAGSVAARLGSPPPPPRCPGAPGC
jgi:hypothetical protein